MGGHGSGNSSSFFLLTSSLFIFNLDKLNAPKAARANVLGSPGHLGNVSIFQTILSNEAAETKTLALFGPYFSFLEETFEPGVGLGSRRTGESNAGAQAKDCWWCRGL